MPSLFENPLTLFPIMAAIFYFVLWRPQQQEQKEAAKLIAGLVRGDRVVTASGVHATVHEAKDALLILEIAPHTFLTVDRETVKKKLSGAAADASTAMIAPAKAGK